MTQFHDPRQAWQADGAPATLPSLAELRDRTRRFERQIMRRNAVEYSAGALVIVLFGAIAILIPMFWLQLGAALEVLGTAFVLWQLFRRASARPGPEAAGLQPIIAHQRAQLATQRDALASVLWWYLLPLVPGIAVIFLAPILTAGQLRMPPGPVIAVMLSIAGFFAAIWWMNRVGARRLQQQIDELDALARD